jgi:hypothetical protein
LNNGANESTRARRARSAFSSCVALGASPPPRTSGNPRKTSTTGARSKPATFFVQRIAEIMRCCSFVCANLKSAMQFAHFFGSGPVQTRSPCSSNWPKRAHARKKSCRVINTGMPRSFAMAGKPIDNSITCCTWTTSGRTSSSTTRN